MQTEKIVCVISARGGSKGVPGKNVRPLNGKPLIAWAIEKALAVPGLNQVVVSTDSKEIAEVALKAGAEVPFTRPAELSNSAAGKFQVWQHALGFFEQKQQKQYDLYVDIDCTNPLIESSDIVNAIELFRSLREKGQAPDAVFTVAHARRNPYFNLVEPDANGVLKMSKSMQTTIVARQSAPLVFEHVAGVYVLDTNYLKTANHLLEGRAFGYEIDSEKAFDIDTELDFKIIEFLFKEKYGK